MGRCHDDERVQRRLDRRTLRRAAEVEFARAKLRAESGAVIGEQEAIEEARSLFPQPGDTEETIAYKRTLLENAVAALKIKAGTAGPGSKASNAAGMPNSSGAGAGGDPLGLRK